jgi:hypothetical protein
MTTAQTLASLAEAWVDSAKVKAAMREYGRFELKPQYRASYDAALAPLEEAEAQARLSFLSALASLEEAPKKPPP